MFVSLSNYDKWTCNLHWLELWRRHWPYHLTLMPLVRLDLWSLQNKYWSSLQCYKYNRACPVDGGWNKWSTWSLCEPPCNQGKRWRTRLCTNPKAENGGFPCRGSLYDEEHCFGYNCTKHGKLFTSSKRLVGRCTWNTIPRKWWELW